MRVGCERSQPLKFRQTVAAREAHEAAGTRLASAACGDETAPTTGVGYVENVYDTRAGLPKGSVKSLRLNRLVDYYACRRPTLNQNMDLMLYKECLGEVPVAADGSAMFRIPAGVSVQLRAAARTGGVAS